MTCIEEELFMFKEQIKELKNYIEDELQEREDSPLLNDNDTWWEDFADQIFNLSDHMMLVYYCEVEDWIGENFCDKWMTIIQTVKENEIEYFGECDEMYLQYGKILTDPKEMYITFVNKFISWVGIALVKERGEKYLDECEKASKVLQRQWRQCRYNPEYKMCYKIFERDIENIELPNL